MFNLETLKRINNGDHNYDYYEVMTNSDKKVILRHSLYQDEKTIEELKEDLKNVKIIEYALRDGKQTIDDILIENPLNNLFDLDISPSKKYYWCNISPMNYSLYEYLKLVKGENDIPKVLKSAFICDCGNRYTITCENYDFGSEITSKNENIIYNYSNILKDELEELLNKSFSHVEIYR